MGRKWTAIVVIMTACATQYGASSAQFTGGYTSETLTHGRHIVRFEGNGSTTIETTTTYVLKRADELCSSGYHVLDVAKLAWVDNNMFGQHLPRGSLVTLLIQCKSPEGGEPELAPDADAPDDHWWCTTRQGSSMTGLCTRTKEQCRTQRAERASKEPYDLCVPRTKVPCYRIIVSGKLASLECRSTLEACGEARADTLFYIQRDYDYNREVSPCEMTE
jgi:hypothetical protein